MTKQRQGDLFDILPDEIIDSILVRLPIRDAVRTSILSSNWRFKWHTMNDLVFDNKCLPPSTDKGNLLNKIVGIIDSVLSLHVGPVQRFKLSTDLPRYPEVDRWINILSRKKVKEISLAFTNGGCYMIPSSLFNCEELNILSLWVCKVKLPASFQQLSKLTSLDLSEVSFPGGSLQALISGCPSLRSLMLFRTIWSGHVKICSPQLRSVIISGDCDDLSFGYLPFLSVASFWFHEGETRSLNFLDGMPNIQKLHFGGRSMRRLHVYGRKMLRLPGRYDHLWSLHMRVDFQFNEDYMTAMYLIRSFPNLELLIMESFSGRGLASTSSACSWKPEDSDLTFNRLKRVGMCSMIGTEQELLLLACLLLNAPLLETITIRMNHAKRVVAESEIYKDLMHHQRASAKAKIVFTNEPLKFTWWGGRGSFCHETV